MMVNKKGDMSMKLVGLIITLLIILILILIVTKAGDFNNGFLDWLRGVV